MGIIKEIFGKVRIYQLRSRVDSRGFMSYVFDENIYDFSIKEARIYSMPKEGTFFGIHYKEENAHSEHINYSDPQIGLKLPMPVSEISDYDQNAPFVFK